MTTTTDLLNALAFPPEHVFTDNEKWSIVRAHRNLLLSRCDWTQIPDAALTPEEKNAWTAYRQALRDLPQDFGNPDDVVFPEQP